MRTSIFTEAWRLYKMYNMTFGEALSLAWTKYKADKLADAMNLADALGHKETVKTCTAELKTLSVKQNSFVLTLRIAYVSTGAQHYYGKGLYNAD